MADITTIAIKVDNADVPKATASLEGMTVAGTKAEASAQRLTRRMALLEIEARNMDAAMGTAQSRAISMGQAWVAAGAAIAAGFVFHELIKNTIEAQNAMAQLEAAVKSTGGVAGRSVEQLDDFSMAMQRTTVYSDEAVKGAQAMLLTFDKIRGTQFDQATQSVADLAARMGGDLQGAAVQVGKALQDPTTGLTALRRSGVSFSESQIELIKRLYETGQVAAGQTIILKELEHQFGGSAAAARNTLGGALTGLKNSFGDLFEVSKGSSASIVAAINAIADAMPNVGNAIGQFVTNTIIGYNNMSAAVQKFNNYMSVDLSHGLTSYMTEVKRLNALVEEERLGANAMAVTQVKSNAATLKAVDATGELSKAEQDRIKKQRETAEDMVREAQQQYELAGLQGDAQAKLKIEFDALNKSIKARREEHHELLPETLKAIEAEEHWLLAAKQRTIALEAETVAIKDAKEAAASFADDMSSKLAKSLSGVFGKDNPIRGFFEELTRDLLRMWLNNFIQPALLAAKGLVDPVREQDYVDASKSTSQSPWVGRGAAGLSGLGIGYGVGSATGNGVAGALGGAAGGAAAGFMLAGPIGAAVGAVTGFVGGILGAGAAAKEAAKHMLELQQSLASNIEAIKATIAGDDLGVAVAKEKAQFDALRKQTEDAYATGKNEKQRNVILAQLNALEAQRIAQLTAEHDLEVQQHALALKRLNEDVQVQILRNNGLAEEADALAKAEDQERRFSELRAQGITEETLELLRQSEVARDAAAAKRMADDAALAAAEALKQAADAAAQAAQDAADKARAQAQAVEDINVEILNAQGHTSEASDMEFQLAQQRRLDTAKKEQSDDYVQRLLELQQLQRDQRAAQQLIDSTTGPSSARSAGATSAMAAVQATVTERTSLVLLDLHRAEVSILYDIRNILRDGSGGGSGGAGVQVHMTLNFHKEVTEDEILEIADRLEGELDARFGSGNTRATLYGGRVGR